MLSGETKVFPIVIVSKKAGLTVRQVNNLAYSGESPTPAGLLRTYSANGINGVRCTTQNDINIFQESRSVVPDYITAQEKFNISKNFFYRNKEKVLPFINNKCNECLHHTFECHPWEEGCKFIEKT